MKLPEFGVKRPIATAMLFVAILVIGVFSLTKLPLDLMPNMEFPSLTVITVSRSFGNGGGGTGF